MIVSASRRTDIPALYAPWLAERLRAGFALVPHPFDSRRVRRVDLRPCPEGEMEAMVLWTRDAGPCLARVPQWERQGLRTLWLVTLTGYPSVLEPGAPARADAVRHLRALAELVGPDRVSWRYDPLCLCTQLGMDAGWHRGNFRWLASAVRGATRRCIVSLYDDYAKARRRLRAAGLRLDEGSGEIWPLLEDLAAAAWENGIELQSCCEDLRQAGVRPGACIDGALLDRLWALGLAGRRDPGQRKDCQCAPSADIGAYDTCTHGCLYCYATDRRREAGGIASESLA